MAIPDNRGAPQGTVAYFRDKSDAELEETLRGGGIGNKQVDGALAEINRRAAARQERIQKWTLLFAAIAAAAGIFALLR